MILGIAVIIGGLILYYLVDEMIDRAFNIKNE